VGTSQVSFQLQPYYITMFTARHTISCIVHIGVPVCSVSYLVCFVLRLHELHSYDTHCKSQCKLMNIFRAKLIHIAWAHAYRHLQKQQYPEARLPLFQGGVHIIAATCISMNDLIFGISKLQFRRCVRLPTRGLSNFNPLNVRELAVMQQ